MTRTARTWTFIAAVLIPAVLLMFTSHQVAFGINLGALAGFLFQALMWAAIVGGGIWLAVRVTGMHAGTGFGNRDTAISTLRQRYAQGEINRAEYFQMKQDLESDS